MKKINDMKTAVIYARSSFEEGTSTNVQMSELFEFCKIHKMNIVKSIKDELVPIDDNRFEELIQELLELKPNYFVVYSWDRISRCWQQATHLVDVLRTVGTEVVAANGPITDIEFKEKFDFFYSILSVLRDVESERNSKKIKAGLRKKKMSNVKLIKATK